MANSLRDAGPDLLRYFLRRVEVQADAADAVGDVFLIAWSKHRAAPQTDHERRLWLFGIARNVVLNRHRASRRARVFADELRSHVQAQNVSADFTETHADAQAVRAAIADLDDKSAELVRLVHWEGMTVADAATVLNLNQSTARSRYQTARAALRAKLDPNFVRTPG